MSPNVSRFFIGTILVFAVFVLVRECRAEPLTWGAHIGSVHLPAKDGQNNENTGIYVRGDGWQAGTYRNTINRQTTYGGLTYALGAGVEVLGGLAHGYQDRDGRGFTRGAFTPIAALGYAPPIRLLGARPRIFFLPPLPKCSAVLSLGIDF